MHLFPDVSGGYVGLERDEATAVARSYYRKFPPLDDRIVLLLDPMLATGGSAAEAVGAAAAAGAHDIRLLCIVAAPEGLTLLAEEFPSVKIYAASRDRGLNAAKFILPGLGDFGDRLYGT
jgi:uracil phosphoribosyltransferase